MGAASYQKQVFCCNMSGICSIAQHIKQTIQKRVFYYSDQRNSSQASAETNYSLSNISTPTPILEVDQEMNNLSNLSLTQNHTNGYEHKMQIINESDDNCLFEEDDIQIQMQNQQQQQAIQTGMSNSGLDLNKLKDLSQRNISRLFEVIMQENPDFQQVYSEKKQPHNLIITMKSYLTQDNFRINAFKNNWLVPGTPQDYQNMMSDMELQKAIDSKLDQFEVVEDIDENTKIIYLSYKKMLGFTPRDFIYMKTSKIIKQEGKVYYVDASCSIEHPRYPPVDKRERGNIILSGNIIEVVGCSNGSDEAQQGGDNINIHENKKQCLIRMYSECDMKSTMALLISKPASINEMRRFTEKCIEKLPKS